MNRLTAAAAVLIATIVLPTQAANAEGLAIAPDPFQPGVSVHGSVGDPGSGSHGGGGGGAPSPWKCKANPDALVCTTKNKWDLAIIPIGQATASAGEVREAVRHVALPSASISVQPRTTTLVNLPTIFFTEAREVRRTVNLLGFSVDLDATPASYRWRFGDGDELTTASAGRPYPHKDITHRYQSVEAHVDPRVDVAYSVRYRVGGGAWQTLDGTISAPGAPGRLRVVEASPVLTTP